MGWDQKASTSLATNYLRLDFQLSGFTDVCVSVHGLKKCSHFNICTINSCITEWFQCLFLYFFICCKNALTRVLLLCKSHNVDAINIVLLRRKTDTYKYHQSYWVERLILTWPWLTQVSNMSSARNFLRVGLTAEKHRELLQYTVWFFFFIYTFCYTHSYRLCCVMNSTSCSSEWGLPGMVSGSSMKGS